MLFSSGTAFRCSTLFAARNASAVPALLSYLNCAHFTFTALYSRIAIEIAVQIKCTLNAACFGPCVPLFFLFYERIIFLFLVTDKNKYMGRNLTAIGTMSVMHATKMQCLLFTPLYSVLEVATNVWKHLSNIRIHIWIEHKCVENGVWLNKLWCAL